MTILPVLAVGTLAGVLVAVVVLIFVSLAVECQPDPVPVTVTVDPDPEYAARALRWIIAGENHAIADACHRARGERLAEIARTQVRS